LTSAQTILVTGASGSIGRALRTGVLGSPHRVIYSARQPGPGFVDLDVTDESRLDDVISTYTPDVIVHLAAMIGPSCEADPLGAQALNVEATKLLAASARRGTVARIVFASTAAVYGDSFHAPVPESGRLDPRSHYARTKLEAERLLREATRTGTGLQVVILRIFNVWGPGFPESVATRACLSTGHEPIVFRGRDEFVRDYVHSDDVATAIALSSTVPLAASCVVLNIGSGVPTANSTLIARARERGRAIEIVEGLPSYSCADISRARAVLGYDPRRLP
jgi:UDP-glucose 4-epimerase